MLEINRLVPELWCADFERSLAFYTEDLGFAVVQRRGRDPHAYLSLQEAQIMLAHWPLEDDWAPWRHEDMAHPFGRGINLQFMVTGIDEIHARLLARGAQMHLALYDADIWRGNCMDRRRQFMILDPDGYALRFAQSLGTRPVEAADLARLDAQ
jgi:catechol 2,3-dioxygenase-like lactoylglutathione lyase family enzyme